MASIDKAITMAPSPLIWNNVAYAFAEQNVQLSRADGYADAAISAVETQLRDVSLANLRNQDLGTAQMLFNVWDTKGWVQFKQGSPDKAEAFILPAWQATGSGAVAEHLGEIAEMRGNRDQAIRYYTMSLATDSPSITASTKLAGLGVTGDVLNSAVAKAKKEMVAERTVKLDATGKGTADFFLLVAPGKIEDVKFVKGEESLRSLADMLKASSVPMKFPPGAQAHVVRRVRLTCGVVPAAKPAPKAKSKTKGAAPEPAAEAAPKDLQPGPCAVEWIPASEVRGID
jgi:hypothetical protein